MRENQFYVYVCVSNNHLPLLHLRSRDIAAVGLTSTTHGEVNIERCQTLTNVTLGDNVESGRVVEDMIIERKVTTEKKFIRFS